MKIRGKGYLQPLEKPVRSCRRWQMRVSLGKDPKTGKYLRRSKVVIGTKTEAQKYLRDFIAELEDQPYPTFIGDTFEEYSEKWLKEREATGYASSNTLKKSRFLIKAAIPYIGSKPIESLDTESIAELIVSVRTEGGREGHGRSGTTCNQIYITVRMVLDTAVSRGVISKNPCNGVKPPKIDTKEKEALSKDEALRLVNLLTEVSLDSYKIGVLLALTCGLRRGEICALRWDDVDFVHSTLKVCGTISGDASTITDPKSRSSFRTIPLDSRLVFYLRVWKEKQNSPSRAVVSNSNGGYLNPSNFARWWRRWSSKNGFSGYSLHQLRHTYATLLCAQGVDLVTASKLMGHSGQAMLMKIYAHRVEENAINAQNALADSLFG